MNNTNYPKPVNFDQNNSDFERFVKEDANSIANSSSSSIAFLKDVRIATNSVVFRYFKVFRDSCILDYTYQKYQKGFGFFLKFIFPKINFSKKRFILITDEWTSNYYHWHAYALKRLLILKENNLLENSLLFLPKKYQKYSFAIPSLLKFGVKKEQIVFLRRKSHIKVKELVMVNTRNGDDYKFFDKIRNILRDDSEPQDRVYISREKQRLRFIENEAEVTELLKKYGFKKILAEDISYEEQIKICSKAKYIVGPHGAGLANLMFMKENCSILELGETLPTIDYYLMSSFLGIKYHYQKCKFGPNSVVKDPHHGSLVVDPKKLEETLLLMLQK
jgi:hypothetical protein